MIIYGIKDIIADEITGVFLAKNDLVACRMNLKVPEGIDSKDFEIVKIEGLKSCGMYETVCRLDMAAEKLGILTETEKED